MELFEPRNYQEIIQSKDKNKWMIAIKEELASLEKNNTWILLKKLKNQRVVGCKWIFKVKKGIFGKEKERYNARLVAKVFTQVEEGGFP